MDYLLRYVQYPVSVADLKKAATSKHFTRLVGYLDELPAETVYQNADQALRTFRSCISNVS